MGAKFSNPNEPRLASVRFRCEDAGCDLVKNILWKSAYHSKQTELPPVDMGSDRGYPSQEVDDCIGTLVRKLHKGSQNFLEMLVEYVNFRGVQSKAGQAGQKNRKCTDALDTQSCSLIGVVSPSKPSWENREQCFPM